MERIEQRQIRVYGIVQGVGFRPVVDRHAHTVGITGTVANRGSYVEINAEGTPDQLDHFQYLVKEHSPERAVILKMAVKTLRGGETPDKSISQRDGKSDGGCPADGTAVGSESPARKYADFSIVDSEKESGEIFISPDIAICDTCKKELFDRKSRRYLHPFINCTCCGPRFSLLEALPYDRERTSMKKFPMCPECSREYHDPASRFYDAQPVCCNDCGPEVYLMESRAGGGADLMESRAGGRAAITRARQILCEGGVIAVKGIGGFHLACDATNESAVMRLRRLKRRPMKPFAVMAKDQGTADRECVIPHGQREIMTGHQKPILLLQKRPGGRICEAVAPDIPTVGLMLPYAPIQLLLFTYDDGFQDRMPDVLVMTSGNASGAPISSTDGEALAEISGFCDAILSNNRDIRIRTDDSVMDFYDGTPYMIRRSRGYAPLPFLISGEGEEDGKPLRLRGNVLGIGGELKNTFCLAKDSIFYPSAYVGDLADVRTVRALEDAVHKTETLLEMEPEIIVCDLHPKYNSGLVAEKIAREKKIPLVRVQHHYAHVLSCMAENDCMEKVIGISLDGTGFGTDGTVWGGEFLLSDLDGFTRCGYIRPFWQIGGDLSSKEGWRIAVSMISGLYGNDRQGAERCASASGEKPGEAVGTKLTAPGAKQPAVGTKLPVGQTKQLAAGAKLTETQIKQLATGTELNAAQIIEKLGLCDAQTARVQKILYDRKMNAVKSTSAGRLFDAVSAILGIRKASTFEGEAATALMYRAMEGREILEKTAAGKAAGKEAMQTVQAAGASAKPGKPGKMDPERREEASASEDLDTERREEASASEDLDPERREEASASEDLDPERREEISASEDILPTDSLVKSLIEAKLAGGDSKVLAYHFHKELARMIVDEAVGISQRTGVRTAALSGGVFQNRLLLELVEKGLKSSGLRVLRHHLVPPNDGGIGLGQALYGMRYLQIHTSESGESDIS